MRDTELMKRKVPQTEGSADAVSVEKKAGLVREAPRDEEDMGTWEWDQVVWYNVIVVGLWHIGSVYAAWKLFPQASSSELLVLWINLWWWSGLGITAGAHRLWAHKSYKAHWSLKTLLMLCNAMAFQGSIFEWARDHRVHHKGSETTSDPHNAKRGFFFSHVGWVFVRKHEDVIREGKKISMADLREDRIVMFQKKYYLPLVLLANYIFPTVLGAVFFGSAWRGFWIGGVFRHVWVLHMTWCVNSIAHLWGDRPYNPRSNPAENLIVSIGAIGEGWHNYHHKYPHDYATGEWGIFSGQWNPTKFFIDVCAALGLAWDMKRSKTAAATRKKNEMLKMEQDAKNVIVHKTFLGTIDGKIGALFFGRKEEEMF